MSQRPLASDVAGEISDFLEKHSMTAYQLSILAGMSHTCVPQILLRQNTGGRVELKTLKAIRAAMDNHLQPVAVAVAETSGQSRLLSELLKLATKQQLEALVLQLSK
jgi:hypothetical protein